MVANDNLSDVCPFPKRHQSFVNLTGVVSGVWKRLDQALALEVVNF